jgi:hypothetical protein
MLRINCQGEGISPPMKKHLELEIKTLQNAPRDPDKLERLLQVKQRKKERDICACLSLFYIILSWLDRGSFALSAKGDNFAVCLDYGGWSVWTIVFASLSSRLFD